MDEIAINLHMHTSYSDGRYTHAQIAKAAMGAGLDAVIVTDHNVLVKGVEGYFKNDGKQVLMLVGEEIHDQARQPQKSHLLVFGADRALSPLAPDPQLLLDGARQAGGLAFIAHPVDPAAPSVNEPDISWVDWQVQGFTGIELWNGFSEFKSLIKSKLHAIYYAYNPRLIAHGPPPATLQKWDELLSNGRKVVAVGGSDAHALPARMGPLRRTLFPYEFHFRTVNTHLLVSRPLSGEIAEDRKLVLDALARGHAFVGYDLPASTKGFRFSAQGKSRMAIMGDTILARDGVTFQVRLPGPAECHLIKDGKVVKTWNKRQTCTHITTDPGAYRVEVYINYLGKRRGWIFSNPIYVME